MGGVFRSESETKTEENGKQLANELNGGTVLALFGGMGMGKTALVRGIAAGMGLSAEVSSPTFALVHDYGGHPPLVTMPASAGRMGSVPGPRRSWKPRSN